MPAYVRCLSVLALFATALISRSALAAETVSVPPFRSIELRGGGHVTLRPGASQQVRLLSGSTRYTRFHVRHRDQLVIDACDEDCPHRYDLDIEIVTPNIEGVALSGGGEIVSRPGFGHQNSIGIAIRGGGEIDVRSIPAIGANAAIDGGGNILLRAERSLHAAVDGGGDISYWGSPSVVSAVNGGGSVNKGG